ncbi:hypothetical protein HOY80DRAFT_1136730 [Tuber brumale]|nr:hypothetical protein HOY80DRAFT_1136730 [Tuber brumale]
MVAIKSLAVLLFTTAVTAVPLAGGNNGNAGDSKVQCGGQGQNLYCCNDFSDSKATGEHVGFLDDAIVKCDHVTSNVQSAQGVSHQSQCNAKAACCSSRKIEQNGFVNIYLGCQAIAAN